MTKERRAAARVIQSGVCEAKNPGSFSYASLLGSGRARFLPRPLFLRERRPAATRPVGEGSAAHHQGPLRALSCFIPTEVCGAQRPRIFFLLVCTLLYPLVVRGEGKGEVPRSARSPHFELKHRRGAGAGPIPKFPPPSSRPQSAERAAAGYQEIHDALFLRGGFEPERVSK